jgi:hypothetical protein
MMQRFGDGGVPAFYQWTGDLPQPGTLLRNEPLPENLLLPEASRGERILYSSTNGLNDKDRVSVSGALFWPKGDAPAAVPCAQATIGQPFVYMKSNSALALSACKRLISARPSAQILKASLPALSPSLLQKVRFSAAMIAFFSRSAAARMSAP